MAWFRKKPDAISARARALNQEIAELEAQIRKLGSRSAHGPAQPRWRSTVVPQSANAEPPMASRDLQLERAPPTPPTSASQDPIFEPVDQDRLATSPETQATPEYFNELGVRKYDLAALIRRLRAHLKGPSTTNPKLVSYLAAGGIQGLRPMRYEKRVARNRFIALALFLFLILLGCVVVFVHRR